MKLHSIKGLLINLSIGIFIFWIPNKIYAQGIEFQNSGWQKILEKAKAHDKLVFLDAYTTWCKPCILMQENVFTHQKVADFYNSRFVNAQFNMESEEGEELAEMYDVKAYPTLLFIDGDGHEIYRAVGKYDPDEFITLGQTALNPEQGLLTFHKIYATGSMSTDLMKKYLELLREAGEPTNKIALEYLNLVKNNLGTEENFKIIQTYIHEADDETVGFLYNASSAFAKIGKKEAIIKKIEQLYMNLVQKAITTKDENGEKLVKVDEQKMEEARKKIKSSPLPNSAALAIEADLLFYSIKMDWNKYLEVAYPHYYRISNDWEKLNNIAEKINQHFKEKGQLEKAIKIIQKSISIEEHYANLHTYASLLYRLENYESSKIIANKAIQFAKVEGADFNETKELVQKLKMKELEQNLEDL